MRNLTVIEINDVSGAGGDTSNDCPPAPNKRPKGNNGWGNGAEGINNGSFSGGTAGSKSDELWTSGDGPRPSKFTTR